MNDSAPVAGRCLNCNSAFAPGQRFCSQCGQRTDVAVPLTLGTISSDILHALTHADHSIFALVRAMITRPGYVAREYVAGRRKRHFGPWAFLLITVGLASAVILITGVEWFKPFSHSHAADVLQRHVNLVMLVQMPVLAAFCALLFRRERLNYAEHLVLSAYTFGFRQLYLALIETPVLALFATNVSDPRLAIGYYGIWFAYFAFAASQFYGGNRWWSACKAVFATLLTQAVTIYLVMAALFLMGGFEKN